MRKKAVQEKRDQEQTAKALVAIEAAAQKQYEADRRSEEEHRKAQTGTWVSYQA